MGKLTDAQKIEVFEKYKYGKSCLFLASEYNVSSESIRRLLKRRGVTFNDGKFKRIYSINEKYFDNIDTEQKAYFFGLLCADGCNYEKSSDIIISLQKEDSYILEQFKKDIQYTGDLKLNNLSKKNSNHKDIVIFKAKDKYLSKKLSEIGCVGKKSQKLRFPKNGLIPDKLLHHFIRGYFDGDGSIGKYKFNHKPNEWVYLCNIVSTKWFCLELKKIFKNKLCINCYNQKTSTNTKNVTRRLRISGRIQITKFLDFIYKDANVFLKRKYLRYKDIKGELSV